MGDKQLMVLIALVRQEIEQQRKGGEERWQSWYLNELSLAEHCIDVVEAIMTHDPSIDAEKDDVIHALKYELDTNWEERA